MYNIHELTEKLEKANGQIEIALQAKYPTGAVIDISKPEGNAHCILGQCQSFGRKYGLSQNEIQQFMQDAMSSDFENLKQTCRKWFGIIFID